MKRLNFVKDILPHLIAIFSFWLVTVIFYQPMVFEGREIRQNDVLQGIGGGQEVKEYREETGEEALWTNSMFAGMPAYMISVSWSDPLVRVTQKIFTLGMKSHAGISLMAMITFYLMLVIFGVSPWVAIAGGLAFSLNSFNILSIEAGHIWKMRAIAYMPLLVGGIHLIFKSSKTLLWGFVVTALAMALQLGANHLQITYYLGFFVAIMGIGLLIRGIQEKNYPLFIKQILVAVLAVGIGVGANLGRLWSSYEYSEYSTRGPANLSQEGTNNAENGLKRDYVFDWSQGVAESLTLLIPNYYGGATTTPQDPDSEVGNELRTRGVPPQQANEFLRAVPTYRGDQPYTGGAIYVGAIVCFLFILGLIILPGKTKWWLLGVTLFGLMMAWGRNFPALNFWLYDHFPMYNKFRAVSMALVIPMLSMPLMGFLAVDRLLKMDKKASTKPLLIAGGVSLLLIIIAVIGASHRGPMDARFSDEQAWLLRAIQATRASMIKADALRSALFILLALGLLYAFVQEKVSKKLIGPLLILVLTLDMTLIDKRYINEETFVRNPRSQWLSANAADQSIQAEGQLHYRVLNLQNPWNEARTSSQHSSLGGYHGAKLKRYAELIDRVLGQQAQQVIANLQSGIGDYTSLGAINMLNTQYFMFGTEAGAVRKNPNAFGNAWFVDTILPVSSADEEMESLGRLRSDSVAIIDLASNGLETAPKTGTGSISLEGYQPNKLTYAVNSASGGLALFSEIHYPKGWKAYVDGEEVDILRANYLLRAIEVPANAQKIEMVFSPKVYTLGNKVTLISNIIIGLGMLGAIFLSFRQVTKEANA